MSEVYSVLDVGSWEPAGEEYLGSKPKQWLREPSAGGLWLWKESTWNIDAEGTRYRKGDDWAERVVREVAVGLGVPTAEVELAVRDDLFGVATKTFVGEGEDLIHGDELLAEVVGVGANSRDRTNYNPDTVRAALQSAAPPTPAEDLRSAVDWFAGYLVLDALVGNTDRHQENWGVVTSAQRRRLAPSFDHASSLGFALSDAEREERLTTRDGNRTAAAYAAKAPSRFEGGPHPIDLAVEMLATLPPAARSHWEHVVEALPGIDPILAKLPTERTSSVARHFARALFTANHLRLSHLLRTMGP